MIKKVLFVFLFFVIALSFVSSTQIQIKPDYSKGEGFVAKISGIFQTPPTQNNIKFYHGQTPTSFDPFSLTSITTDTGTDYYVYSIVPLGKTPGNYSIRVEGIQYYIGNNQWSSDPVSKGFVIEDHMVFATISPALSIPEDYYYNLTLENTGAGTIEIEYGLEGTETKTVALGAYQTKDVTLKTFGGDRFENVLFTYGNETYTAIVYSGLDDIPVENQTIGENETSNETEGKSFWEIIFGGGEEEPEENETIINETEPNGTNVSTPPPGGLLTCQEMGLLICSEDQTCAGVLIDGFDAQCCDGNCVLNEEEGSSLGLIGWIIIGIVVIILVLFFKFKFSRTRRMPSRLLRR
ncbi:MAG: hypothetical protein KKB62_03760 [Nanoarchaeota archaeon]|nr:hypothetical protein [Nanoarchaeota archaeon]